MTPEQFAYWLQGHLEIRGTDEPLGAEQVKVIREHLAKVLTHVPAPDFARDPGTWTDTGNMPHFGLPTLIC